MHRGKLLANPSDVAGQDLLDGRVEPPAIPGNGIVAQLTRPAIHPPGLPEVARGMSGLRGLFQLGGESVVVVIRGRNPMFE